MNIQEKVYDILKNQFCISVEEINLETNLIDELGFDSISFVELAGFLSRDTGIKIDQHDAIEWTSINSILETVSTGEK